MKFRTKKEGCLNDNGEAQLEQTQVVQDWIQEVLVYGLILFLDPKLLKQYNSLSSLTVFVVLPVTRSWKTQQVGKKVTKHYKSWVSFLMEIRLLERFGT